MNTVPHRIPAVKRALRLAAIGCLGVLAHDSVAVTCSVSSSGLSFGPYDVYASTATNANATIGISCSLDPSDQGATKLQPYNVTLSTGSSLSFVQRTMQNGADSLGYNIYTTNAYATVWGDGTGSTAVQSGSAVLNNGHPTATNSFTAYGRIPALQDVSVGSYNDNVTATINW